MNLNGRTEWNLNKNGINRDGYTNTRHARMGGCLSVFTQISLEIGVFTESRKKLNDRNLK